MKVENSWILLAGIILILVILWLYNWNFVLFFGVIGFVMLFMLAFRFAVDFMDSDFYEND